MIPLAIPIDDETRDLVVTALRSAGEQRQRAATKAAGELADEKANGTITDERPGAVKIARWLADAAKLDAAAGAIAAAPPAITEDAVRAQFAELTTRMAPARPSWAPVPKITELILATFPNVGVLAAQGIAWAVHGGAFDAQPEDAVAPSPAPAATVQAPPVEVAPPPPAASPTPAPPDDDGDGHAAPGKVPVAEALLGANRVLHDLGMTFVVGDGDLEFPEDFDDGRIDEDDPGPVGNLAAVMPELAPAPTE